MSVNMNGNPVAMNEDIPNTPGPPLPLPSRRSVAEIFAAEISLSYEERVRKALNLTPYLNFLTDLFTQEISDSSDSDDEIQFPSIPAQAPQHIFKEEDSKFPAITQAIHTLNMNLGEASSSTSYMGQEGVKPEEACSSGISLQFPLPATSPFSPHSSYSSSLAGLSPDTSDAERHQSQEGTELTPISDLELHKYLERPGRGSPMADIISLLGPTDSDFKPNRKRKWDHQSALIPNVESATVPKTNSSSVTGFSTSAELNPENITLGRIGISDVKNTALKIKEDPDKVVNQNYEDFRACMKNTASHDKLNLNQTANFEREENEDECEDAVENKVNEGIEEEEDDSLSDYMNITATSSLALDSYFKFDAEELTSSANSPPSPTSGSLLPSLTHPIKFENPLEMDDNTNADKLTLCSGGNRKDKKISDQKQGRMVQIMNIKRRRIYIHICKKEVVKAARVRMQTFGDTLVHKNRLAIMCANHLHQEAVHSQKLKDEAIWRSNSLDHGIQGMWKQIERAEKEPKRRKEIEAKSEVNIPCQLTSLQRSQYSRIKRRIRVEDLAKSFRNSHLVLKETTKLMSLLFELRKVCNHPDLFQRREVKSPFYMEKITEVYPSILFDDGEFELDVRKRQFLNDLSIYNPTKIHDELLERDLPRTHEPNSVQIKGKSEWCFTRLIRLDPLELFHLVNGSLSTWWIHILKMYQLYEDIWRDRIWNQLESRSTSLKCTDFILFPNIFTAFPNIQSSPIFKELVFVSPNGRFHGFVDEKVYSSQIPTMGTETEPMISVIRPFGRSILPPLFTQRCSKVVSAGRSFTWLKSKQPENKPKTHLLSLIRNGTAEEVSKHNFHTEESGGLQASRPLNGWSHIVFPSKDSLILDSGKLRILDILLKRFISEGHKILLFSCMGCMLNILEDYFYYRKLRFVRLDACSNASDRQRAVAEFETKLDLQILLLSTKAAATWGLNLTAADTAIFYDSDMISDVDEYVMDRCVSLCQTKKITVFRLASEGTIEEKILQRTAEKSLDNTLGESEALKPADILSLLLSDEELNNLKEYNFNFFEKCFLDAKPSGSKRKFLAHQSSSGRDRPSLVKKFKCSEMDVASSVGSSASGTGSSPADSEIWTGGDDEFELFDEEDEFESEDEETGNTFADIDCVDGPLPSTSHFCSDWNTGSVSDYDEEIGTITNQQKVIRGRGRGRPPTRVRVMSRDEDGSRRGRPVGRPRLKRIGPLNQSSAVRGRKPGRPPLSKKAETVTLPSQDEPELLSRGEMDPV